METTVSIEVEQRLKYGVPLGFYWLVPNSWRRVYLEEIDITNELSQESISELWDDQPWYKAEIEVDVEVEGKVTPGTPDYFCRSMGNWHPGDSPEVDVDVWLGKLKITGLIDADEMNRIEDKFYEQWEEPEHEYDDY